MRLITDRRIGTMEVNIEDIIENMERIKDILRRLDAFIIKADFDLCLNSLVYTMISPKFVKVSPEDYPYKYRIEKGDVVRDVMDEKTGKNIIRTLQLPRFVKPIHSDLILIDTEAEYLPERRT